MGTFKVLDLYTHQIFFWGKGRNSQLRHKVLKITEPYVEISVEVSGFIDFIYKGEH